MSFPRLLLGLLPLLVLSACGGPEPAPATEPPASGPLWMSSKPSPTLGTIQAAVVERPSPDRAVLEVRWFAREGLDTCELEIVVPDAVILLEGESALPLPDGVLEGTTRWLVEFPTGRDIDAVLRFCGHTSVGKRTADVAVRLTSAPVDGAD